MKKKDRMKQILDQTCELLCEKSLDAIRTAEIARKAGISEGTLFKYFKTKDELLRKIIESYLEMSYPLIEVEKINSIDEFRDFFNKYFTIVISKNEKTIPYLRLLLQISMQEHPLAKRKYMNVKNGFWKIAENRIEYGKNTGDLIQH